MIAPCEIGSHISHFSVRKCRLNGHGSNAYIRDMYITARSPGDQDLHGTGAICINQCACLHAEVCG